MLSPTQPIDRPRLYPGTGYFIAPRVPHGLAAVVEGLTREVLRHRPEDIYVFAAHHFEKLLKLREQYQAEEYSYEFTREFNLWPTKETKDSRKSSTSSGSLEKEVEIIENNKKVFSEAKSREDVSTDEEKRKASKQTCIKSGPSTTKRISKKLKDNETTSEARATRIISQMSALHGPGKSIQTKDIKQELRKNKMSGDKARATNGAEKGVRSERRSKTRASKSDKSSEEEIDRATTTTTTTTSSSRTSARRPLKKVRRIETESETETEREVEAAKPDLKNNRSSVIKSNSASCETIARAGSRERRSEARLSAHFFERKVPSRALSMDRIRAYVLRKFASTASLEVLRSPTYVEQVQEVIDRAAPIIKEKLEEIRRPRGKRSRSVDLAWNDDELFHQRARDERKRDDREKEMERRRKSENGSESDAKKEETESSLGKDERILSAEREKKKMRRRSGSGKRSRRRENSGHDDSEVIDQNSSSKHSNKSEHESGATHDTLEARLTATQNILEDISKSTCELGGARRIDSAGSESTESEGPDHANISLPVVRPPSSRNSRSAARNGSDNLTLPPISPEAPKSTKKKDDLSLPVLPAANGNHSAKKSQNISKDADEASTMCDITSDIEDIAILPEDATVDAKQDSSGDHQDLMSDVKITEVEKRDKDVEEFSREDETFAEKRGSLKEFEELEQLEKEKAEEVFKDSLNVTPEVMDVPSRPDSLEPDDQRGEKLQDDDADAQGNACDDLKDKLIEIEMAERSIEKALAGQKIATGDGGKMTSQAEKSMTDGTINETGKPANEAEGTASEIEKSTDEGKTLMNKDNKGRKDDDKKRKKLASKMEKGETEISTDKDSSSKAERSTDKIAGKEVKDKMTELRSETENSNAAERSTTLVEQTENKEIENKIEILTEESTSEIKKSTNETSEAEISKNRVKITKHQAENITEDEKSTNRSEETTNKKLPNGVEELAVKVHVQGAQSANLKSRRNGDRITETVVCETGDDSTTASKSGEAEEKAPSELPKASTAGSAAIESETSMTNPPGGSGKTKERRKRETGKSPATSPLSLDIPYSYVLSEGSPCEIPDSVTTVIIPDRPCPSPVILEDDARQLAPTKESLICSDMTNKLSQDKGQKKDQSAYGVEAFGEYIHPEVIAPVDIDFVRNKRSAKASQDLDRIKEEGEEEEEREDGEEKGTEIYQKEGNDKQTVVQDTEKLAGTLENIAEHENEETEKTSSGFKDTEKIPSSNVLENESPPASMELTIDIDLIDEGKVDVAVECKSTLENLSEESSQDTRTTTSSDVKESTTSTRSDESPSTGIPIVPELNLDSLQDNTVSSFKMTANDTTVTKEDNGSAGESDATMSLVEPLTSDEMNRLALAEEDLVAEELTESLLRKLQMEGQAAQSKEADQLYPEEHAEYEWLEKDPLHESNIEDEISNVKSSTGLKDLPEEAQVCQSLEEKEEDLCSEEEIAKVLISSLDKDMQICVEELQSSKEESKDEEEDIKSNVNDKSNQSISHSISTGALEKKECKVSSEEIETLDDKKSAATEVVDELSSSVTDNKDKNTMLTNKEAEESKLKVKEHVEKVASLAQSEQNELEQNSRPETADKKTVKNESDLNVIVNQEKPEDKQANIKVLENKSIENVSKIEESNVKHEKNDLEKLQEQKEETSNREEREREKSETQEECEQNELNIQEKNIQGNLESREEIVNMQAESLETAESREASINESTKNDDKHEETKLIINDEFATDNRVEERAESEEKEKTENLSAKTENARGAITSAISKQSSDSHSRGYWTMETKSSTVETVIEANDSNTSVDEKTEAVVDTREIIEGESSTWKKNDVYSAVLKIQACTRGFLARRRMRKDLNSKPALKDISPTQETTVDNHLLLQNSSNVPEGRTGRHRLRREEALRNTTLSLENAFASGRLQHTGEFHDSVPLLLFDVLNSNKTSSTASDDAVNKEVGEYSEQSNAAKPNTNNSGSTHDRHGETFQKRNVFTNSFPIVMHLLADATRNFGVKHPRPDFNANTAGAKPALDMLMMDCSGDDDNRYLNFITSVEDLGCGIDTLDDAVKSSKNVDDVRPSTTSGEGSLREPLALPGTPQGVVIEEVTSLDETEIPSESTKPSTAPRTSLDTNSSMPLEECTLEDGKNDSDKSPRTADAIGDRKRTDEEQNSDCNLGNAGAGNSLVDNANKKSNETISRDNHKRTNDEQNEKR